MPSQPSSRARRRARRRRRARDVMPLMLSGHRTCRALVDVVAGPCRRRASPRRPSGRPRARRRRATGSARAARTRRPAAACAGTRLDGRRGRGSHCLRRRVGAVLLVGLVLARVLASDRERVELVALIVHDGWSTGSAGSRLEHAEAERGERVAGDSSVLRARDDVVPRRRQEGRDLVLDRAVRLVVGRQERAHLGVGGEAVAQELDGTRLRDRVACRVDGVDGVRRR